MYLFSNKLAATYFLFNISHVLDKIDTVGKHDKRE